MELEASALRELIVTALDECDDTGTLDLVYKILVMDKSEGRA